MINKKLYPFTRNHYFYGKLLTVRDFEEEQRYFNDKRRLNNLLFTGPGVVLGMDTVQIDDKTLSIEAGLAVDYQGREIVIPDSVTCRLDVLDGFDRLMNTEETYLCVEYEEKGKEEVHSIGGAMAGGEVTMDYNRMSEGYRLYLTDVKPEEELLSFRSLAVVRQVVFSESGLKIIQEFPRYANPGQNFLIRIKVEKLDIARPVTITYKIASRCFSCDGSVQVVFEEKEIKTYYSTELVYPVQIRLDAARGAVPVVAEEGNITIGSAVYPLPKVEPAMVQIVMRSPIGHMIQNYRKLHFEEVTGERGEAALYLARLQLIKRAEVYYIEQIEALPFQQYVLSNTMLSLLLEAENGISIGRSIDVTVPSKPERSKKEELAGELAVGDEDIQRLIAVGATNEPMVLEQLQTASGIVRIETDLRSSGITYYSDEIAHGLGPGRVEIRVAAETKEESPESKLVFGNPCVFLNSPYETGLPEYQIGIIADPARGTFRIGVSFLGDIKVPHIMIQWWAYRKEQKKEPEYSKLAKIQVCVEPSTAQVKTKEKFQFQARIEGGESQDCNWSVLEPGGGWIDREGVYEAPAKEGVYEVIAESTRYPGKRASAFIVVKKDEKHRK